MKLCLTTKTMWEIGFFEGHVHVLSNSPNDDAVLFFKPK